MPASGAAGAADLDQRRELGARVHFGGHAGEVCLRVDDHCFEAGASLPEDEESESSLLEGEAAGAATLGAVEAFFFFLEGGSASRREQCLPPGRHERGRGWKVEASGAERER